MQSTEPMPRDVNPVFRHTFVFSSLASEDVLRVTIRDRGLFAAERFGGVIGPQVVVATCTMKVGANFDGHLDMEPCRNGYGKPVIHLVARFPEYTAINLPPVGVTQAMTSIFETQARTMSPDITPSAPPALICGDDVTDPPEELKASELGVPGASEESGCGGVPAASEESGCGGVPEASGCGGVPKASGCGGVPKASEASGCWNRSNSPWARGASTGASSTTAYQPSSSPFFVDGAVFELAPANLVLKKIFDMQQSAVKQPFPVGGFRNYNCWAVGFDRHAGDWHQSHIWGPLPDKVVPDIVNELLPRLEKLGEATGQPDGLRALIRLMQLLKDRIQKSVHVQTPSNT